jgi:general secretion pathway protein G
MNRHRLFGKGFTLIELLVVILILAILAALIVPNIMGRGEQAKRAKAQSDVAQLANMVQTFKLDTGRFPTPEEGLQALRSQPSDVTGWQGPYSRKEIPLDPWGMEYVYEYPGPDGDNSFQIFSYGPDKAPGGEGDSADIGEDTGSTAE